jgi:hypothetical protein
VVGVVLPLSPRTVLTNHRRRSRDRRHPLSVSLAASGSGIGQRSVPLQESTQVGDQPRPNPYPLAPRLPIDPTAAATHGLAPTSRYSLSEPLWP